MRTIKYSKAVGFALFFVIAISLLTAIYSHTLPNRMAPLAKQGVLDLTQWDLHNNGVINLDGEWEFYKDELLEPKDFVQGRAEKAAYLTVPGTWRGESEGSGISRKGAGTYRLTILLKDKDEVLGLKIRSVRMAHRLFINDVMEGGSGTPAMGVEGFQPSNTPYTVFFHSDTAKLEILLQVSNFNFVTGGIVNSIPFGTQGRISEVSSIQLGADIGIILILAMFGAYHFSFYFLGRREKAYLLSGLYLLLQALQDSLYGEKVFQRFFPDLPFNFVYKLLEISQFLGAIIIFMFFCSVESRLMSAKKLRLLLLPFALYLIAVVTLPYSVHISVKYFLVIYMAFAVAGLIIRMIYLYIRNQQPSSDRSELLLIIVGAFALLVFLVDSSLYSENVITNDLVGKCGVVIFIVLINIMLALRFSNAYANIEVLSRRLMVSNQLKDEFLMNTSHELKTPLHGIMNMTSYLLEDMEENLQPSQKQNLWLIKDTATKLSMLIEDLIDVSRLKHGELRLQMTVVDLRVAAQIVIDVLQFELAGKKVELENLVAHDTWVLADESRLQQVLYNLVHNAIKHTEEGEIRITCSLAENVASIVVEDTGTGIPLDKQETIFEYFEQVEKPLPKDGYTGMGVGLYISRKLVERMGGEIRVEWSELGLGTRMLFTMQKMQRIPGYRESAATAENKRLAHTELISLDDIDPKLANTILIVDDEASNIHSLLHILRRHHYNVITAFSAREALDKMNLYPDVDLVILDVMMPGISGIELCRTLRTKHSILELPILFATVKDSASDLALGFRAGANDYVTKPFDVETLIARIQTLIAMKTSFEEALRNEQAFHQAQIKPHFLYNALSNVISFCYTDGEKAAYLLTMLSQYIRFILDMDRSTLVVPLHRELELIHAYVEIEKARFGERFDYVLEVDKGLAYFEIPALSIQPFVENAIRHGLFEKEGQGRVSLTVQAREEYIKITVEDDGIGIPDDLLYKLTGGEREDGGIGIANVRQRVERIAGAALSIHSKPEQGTIVTIYLPIEQG
ncbi:ATP-binding protein [Paenibacillus sp. NPDC058177]|uniref:hybrid sensor histidine kinase/response regulator n=1 Tax=Paenibacillus sp. NPDC058177 TaxID=3346369 RepID=UPI0036DDBC6A